MTFVPAMLSQGKMESSVVMGLSFMPNILGIEGPVISASRIAVLLPFLRVATAIREVTRDLPTPPFPLTTPITLRTFDI